jgi:hypothetical protein
MKIWRVSGIFFREDDTFVAVFAFVHLRDACSGCQLASVWLVPVACARRRQSPGHSHRISFSRGAHEAVAGACVLWSAGQLFSCQVAGSRGCVWLEQ